MTPSPPPPRPPPPTGAHLQSDAHQDDERDCVVELLGVETQFDHAVAEGRSSLGAEPPGDCRLQGRVAFYGGIPETVVLLVPALHIMLAGLGHDRIDEAGDRDGPLAGVLRLRQQRHSIPAGLGGQDM